MWLSFAVAGLFVVIDTGFFAANSMKIAEGGYVPLLLAACNYGLMLIWHRGSAAIARQFEQTPLAVCDFLADLKRRGVPRVPGTAVFLTRTARGAPPVLLWHVQHNRALHERVVVLRVLSESKPRVHWPHLMSVVKEGENFWRVTAHVPHLLEEAQQRGCAHRMDDITYYVGYEIILHRRAWLHHAGGAGANFCGDDAKHHARDRLFPPADGTSRRDRPTDLYLAVARRGCGQSKVDSERAEGKSRA